jgi:sulfur carrier protein ThiS adenylyltransferase
MGSLQALEAMKILCAMPSTLNGRLGLFDGKSMTWRTLQLTRANDCALCSALAGGEETA